MTTTVYNLKSEKVHKRLLAKDFEIGDVWLFSSGSSQACTHCHGIIIAGKGHIIQRLGSDKFTFWNDHYHLSCATAWLINPVAELMEVL